MCRIFLILSCTALLTSIAWGLDPPAGTPGHEDLPESDLEREFRFLTGVSPLRANRLTP